MSFLMTTVEIAQLTFFISFPDKFSLWKKKRHRLKNAKPNISRFLMSLLWILLPTLPAWAFDVCAITLFKLPVALAHTQPFLKQTNKCSIFNIWKRSCMLPAYRCSQLWCDRTLLPLMLLVKAALWPLGRSCDSEGWMWLVIVSMGW